MKTLYKYLFVFFSFFIINSNLLFSQGFQKNVFIDIPGNNYDFDLYTPYYWGTECYLTWINKNDSIYSVYIKKISPVISDNILVSSDSIMKLNPKIASNYYSDGIKIVWQNYLDNYYEIVMRHFINDTLDNKTIIKDSLVTNPQLSISAYRMVWAEEGKIHLINFYPTLTNSIVVDSSGCSSLDIIKDDNITSTKILYSKEKDKNHLIYFAEYYEYPNHNWSIQIISESDNRNANFGTLDGVSLETINNNLSKIKYSTYGAINFSSTENSNCNYKNPYVFAYPQPIIKSSLVSRTPYFVAFDTDSLENNNEVFIKTFYLYDSLINISNMEGNDYKPKVSYVTFNDTLYVAIFWLHEENNKTDIWLAKDLFNPVYVSVKDENIEPKSYKLMQNYPNPFNPSTTIQYSIQKESFITLKVYDVLGKQIATLVSERKAAGNYSVDFNSSNLPSGVYFYRMQAGNFVSTKKFVLLK